jgi:hypothetical protein
VDLSRNGGTKRSSFAFRRIDSLYLRWDLEVLEIVFAHSSSPQILWIHPSSPCLKPVVIDPNCDNYGRTRAAGPGTSIANEDVVQRAERTSVKP